MEEKNCVASIFIKLFSVYLGWVSCFYFSKITFSITSNAPLNTKIFNNKTYITLFLLRKLLLLSYALLFTISLMAFVNYICHLFCELRLSHLSFIVLLLSLSCQSWMVNRTLCQIMSRNKGLWKATEIVWISQE